MFLWERIIGVCIYSLALLIFVVLIKKDKESKKLKKYLIFYAIILAIMGYFYYPYKTADLHQIKRYITLHYVGMPFDVALNLIKNSRMPVMILYYWVFGQIGNLNLLPATTAFIFYSIVFYIFYKTSKRNKWSSDTNAKILIYFMAAGQFLEVISGIRSMLAFSIVAFAIYRELYEEKSFVKNIPLYLIAVFLHDASFVLVTLRIIFLLFQKENNRNLRFLYRILTFAIMFYFILNGKAYFEQIMNHGIDYLDGVDTYFYLWEYLIALLCVIFTVYSNFKFKKIIKKYNINDYKILRYHTFVKLVTIVNIVFFFEYSIFERFRIFLMFLAIPIVGQVFSYYELPENKNLKNYNTAFLFIMLIVYVLAVTRGNLCNLKFFEF